MLGRAVLLGAAVLLPQLAKAQHTCADQNNDGVVDNGVGKQPDAFTVASCDLGYSLKADLAAATCATQVCTSAECCDAPTDKPHPVDGSGVSFGLDERAEVSTGPMVTGSGRRDMAGPSATKWPRARSRNISDWRRSDRKSVV